MKRITLLVCGIIALCATGLLLSRNFADAKILPKKAAAPCFLFLSDVHLDTYATSTKYGSDTGMDLWKRFLAKVDSVLNSPNSPQFVIYTGDLPAHYPCNCSAGTCYLPPSARGTHNQNTTVILKGLRSLVAKYHKALFYLPGNNDGLAGDYASFTDDFGKTPFSLVPDSSNPYPALNINRGSAKAPCLVSNLHPQMGYYAARPVAGLRLIAMNTVIYSGCFAPVDGTTQQADGDTQLVWLAAQLAVAKQQKEKVYIAMHIPPGIDAYSGNSMWTKLPGQKKSWLDAFLSLTNRYQSTIAGILYGHTHMEEVRRLYDTTGTRITEVAISCPGVTPQHYNNPGFKTVVYDAMSKELMDFTTYYTQPVSSGWGNQTYTFSASYQNTPKTSIYTRLSSMSFAEVLADMGNIFTVQNGPAGYDIQRGIEVKTGQ